MLQKLKLFVLDDTVYISLLIILVGVLSFALGRFSSQSELNVAGNNSKTGTFYLKSNDFDGKAVATSSAGVPVSPVTDLKDVPKTGELAGQTTTTANTIKKFVASKSGTKYHLLTCPGAKNIKEANKVYFSTEAEAESSGYVKASNCPGI